METKTLTCARCSKPIVGRAHRNWLRLSDGIPRDYETCERCDIELCREDKLRSEFSHLECEPY
jgi:hypothetical protein